MLLPGIEGRPWEFRQCIPGLREAGLECTVDVIEWGHGAYRDLKNLTDLSANLAHAHEVAARIAAYQHEHPDEAITVVGYSGGGGLALLVVEALPPGVMLERVILMAAAVAPDHDVHPVLAHARRGVLNFYSPRDSFVLGAGTRTFGTIDRKYTASAGYVGFQDSAGQLLQCEGLTQIPWTQDWLKLGHDGGHIGWLARPWARAILAHEIDPNCPVTP
ncbi:MAG TPA: hypothetical protein VGM03_00790 [Phycisphaerae bacterium]